MTPQERIEFWDNCLDEICASKSIVVSLADGTELCFDDRSAVWGVVHAYIYGKYERAQRLARQQKD